MDDPINWNSMEEARFNRVVEMLLVRVFTDPAKNRRARALSGRGGDGGVDVGVWDTKTDEIVAIYQLKHYTDGWPSRGKGRRPAIKESFERAWSNHKPKEWTLVTPSNPSPGELTFVKDLRGERDVVVDVLGAAELDGLLGDTPAVLQRFGVDRGRELLRDVGREEHAMNRSGDVFAVMSKMQTQIRKRSDHWGVAVSVDEHGNTTQEFRALTEDASDREPLEIDLSTSFSPETAALRETYDDAMRFGLTEPVTLDSRVVDSVTFKGPDWFAAKHQGGEITLLPLENGEDRTATIEAKTRSGQRMARINGVVKVIAPGSEAGRVVVESPGGLVTRWMFPFSRTGAGKLDFSTDFSGHRIREVRALIRFLTKAPESGRLELEIQGKDRMVVAYDGHAFPRNPTFESYLDDLIQIEDELDVTFILPEGALSSEERIWARIATLLLQGKAVAFPGINGYNSVFHGEQEVAEALDRGPTAMVLQDPDFELKIFGTQFHLGTLFTYQHQADFIDGAEHAAAVRDGDAAGRHVQIRADNDLPYLVYLPERREGPSTPIVPWGLPQLDEHSKLETVQQLQLEGRLQLPGPEQIRS